MTRKPNVCQAGHEVHATKTVDTVQGPFIIFDWEQYRSFDGYCTGQDDISMSLDLYGTWEPEDFEIAKTMPGPVFDFGAHIGWYSRPFADVVSIEPDLENVRLLRENCPQAEILPYWSHDLAPLWGHRAGFVKADVEGDEDDVMRVIRPVLPGPVLLLECSPEFADYYPALIEELREMGYKPSQELGETQVNIWFT